MTRIILSQEIMDKYSLHPCPGNDGVDNQRGSKINSDGSNNYDWSWIDTIFCICLKGRDDRLQHSINQFNKYGLSDKVIYHRPEPPSKELVEKYNLKEKGRYGCWEAHRHVTWIARNIFKSKLNLIFEDDILFSSQLYAASFKTYTSSYSTSTKTG